MKKCNFLIFSILFLGLSSAEMAVAQNALTLQINNSSSFLLPLAEVKLDNAYWCDPKTYKPASPLGQLGPDNNTASICASDSSKAYVVSVTYKTYFTSTPPFDYVGCKYSFFAYPSNYIENITATPIVSSYHSYTPTCALVKVDLPNSTIQYSVALQPSGANKGGN